LAVRGTRDRDAEALYWREDVAIINCLQTDSVQLPQSPTFGSVYAPTIPAAKAIAKAVLPIPVLENFFGSSWQPC